jgi:CRP/FNR family transcriptional regulator
MSTISLIQSHSRKTCLISDICIGVNPKQANSRLSRSHRIFHKKNTLFIAGDDFIGVYMIRSGSAKSFVPSEDGEEHITKFHFAGEFIGLDGFGNCTHTQSIEFLETSSVYFIGVKEINVLITNSVDFRQNLLKAMSSELIADSAMSMCYSIYTSEQRLAKFLLDLSTNFIDRGQSGTEFLLSMSRTDIANYLGMVIETVCRVLGRFQEKGVIDIHQRMIKIINVEDLTNRLYGANSLNKPVIYDNKLNVPRTFS